MKNILIALICMVVYSQLLAQDPMQKLNIPDERGWDKPERFTVTDRIWPTNHGEADVCMYPDDALAAVSYTVDDNACNDHDWWIQTMDKYGWKMTWFVIVEYLMYGKHSLFGNWEKFRRLHDLGHSIQSHTMTHGHCNDPDYYMVDDCPEILTGGWCCDINYEYGESQKLIRDSIPGAMSWTIAYSGHKVTGREATVAGTTFIYDAYAHEPDTAAKYYIGGRGTGGYPNLPHRTHYLNTNSGGVSQDQIDMILDPATRHYYRGWIAELWHGKGDTNVNYTNFDYIKTKEDAGDLWVALYEDILRYTQSWVTRILEMGTVTDSVITFTVGDSMRDTIYNYPLTVKVRVNNDWSTVYAAQNGETVEAKLVEYQANKYVLVKAVPDAGSVVISKAPTTYIKDKTIMADSHPSDLLPGPLYGITGSRVLLSKPASGFYLHYDEKRGIAQKILIIDKN